MPVYEFDCPSCGRRCEELRRLGEDSPPACPSCEIGMRRVFSRVAVRYGSWGFRATDSLISDTHGRDFKALRERAERISDGGE